MAMGSGYQMGGGAGGGPGYQLAGAPAGASGPVMGGVALSTPGGTPKTVQQMWEDVDRLRHPEKYMKADPAAARQEPRGLYVPPGYFGGGGSGSGGFGLNGAGAPPYLQEPLQPGMFEGTVTLLSAVVEAEDSEAAADAIVRSPLNGQAIIRASFGRRSAI